MKSSFTPAWLELGTAQHQLVDILYSNQHEVSHHEVIKVYADLPGHSINGGTLPPHIAITSSRPDLVIIDSADKTVWLLELTVSFETNFEAAHNRKKVRYTALAQDIVSAGYNCQNIPFEIGSRGHISLANKSTLTVMHSLCKPDERLRTFVLNISKISLLCSYSIFLSRKEPTWTSVEPLRARKWANHWKLMKNLYSYYLCP